MQLEALALRRDLFDERHPHTIRIRAELARTYYAQDRLMEAEKIQTDVRALRHELLGERHPDTLAAMYDLAVTWKSMDRDQEAIALMQHCYDLSCSVLGTAHPDTVDSARWLDYWKRLSLSSDSGHTPTKNMPAEKRLESLRHALKPPWQTL